MLPEAISWFHKTIDTNKTKVLPQIRCIGIDNRSADRKGREKNITRGNVIWYKSRY